MPRFSRGASGSVRRVIRGTLTSRSGPVVTVTGALLVLLALVAWALASPVGATPDEEYHLTSVWCGNGLQEGACEAGTGPTTRTVPTPLLAAPCFAFDADVSATCQGTSLYDDDPATAVTDRGNFVGDYPPVFYFVMHLFVGDDIASSVIAMRVFNAVFALALLAAVYVASPPGLRRPLIGGLTVTAVPLGMFILPSINPSSWAILSAGTFLVSVLGYLTAPDRRRRLVLGGLAALALLVGAGARADAAIYAVLAVVVALVMALPTGRANLRRAVYPVVLAVVAGIAYLTSGQSGAATGTAVPHSLGRAIRVLIDVPDLWVGALGGWGLGWLDTPMPPLVWVGSFGVFAAAVFYGASKASTRHGAALVLVAAAVWAVPAYIQYLSGTAVGAFVQPRYILPLLTILAVTAMVRLDGAAFRLTPVQRWAVVLVLSAANTIALYVNLRRYVTGLDVDTVNLDAGVEWWWSGPVTPMGVWFVGSLAFGVGLLLLSAEMASVAPARVLLVSTPQDDADPVVGSEAGASDTGPSDTGPSDTGPSPETSATEPSGSEPTGAETGTTSRTVGQVRDHRA